MSFWENMTDSVRRGIVQQEFDSGNQKIIIYEIIFMSILSGLYFGSLEAFIWTVLGLAFAFAIPLIRFIFFFIISAFCGFLAFGFSVLIDFSIILSIFIGIFAFFGVFVLHSSGWRSYDDLN